jgi:serine/threonine-protein phosphatase 5
MRRQNSSAVFNLKLYVTLDLVTYQRLTLLSQAIEVGEEKSAVERCREVIAEGGCSLESSYTGPQLTELPGNKYAITEEFITSMIEWFKSGKALARRYVWEIVLGCYDAIVKEESLVELQLEEGVTCDVIGDTHGQFFDLVHLLSLTQPPSKTHCLLFNGDFVDRGSWSVEVAITLFAYKCG